MLQAGEQTLIGDAEGRPGGRGLAQGHRADQGAPGGWEGGYCALKSGPQLPLDG